MFLYYLKMKLRSKGIIWGLLFPLALMLMFKLTFTSIVATENKVDMRRVSVVESGEGLFVEGFESMMDELSKETDDPDELRLDVSYDELNAAKQKLDDGDIDFYYIVSDDDVKLVLPASYSISTGMIAREISDTFKVNMELIEECMTKDPSLISEVTESLSDRLSYIVIDAGDEGIDMYQWYYISTLVMSILFDYAGGIAVLGSIRADVSGSAMRVAASSVSKTRAVFSCLMSEFVVSLVKVFIQVCFLNFVVGINMFTHPVLLITAIALSTIFAICIGILLGMVFKGDMQSRENKTMGLVMLSVFLSGEMIVTLPGAIEKYAPIVNKINPATVINKIFYRLLLCENFGDLYTNFATIAVLSVLMFIISIIILRRETYASL